MSAPNDEGPATASTDGPDPRNNQPDRSVRPDDVTATPADARALGRAIGAVHISEGFHELVVDWLGGDVA